MTFRSTLQPDDPIVQDARFRFDATDRAYIDEQTRACEFFIAECLLNGVHATYGTLAGSSATIAVGDVLCLSNAGTGTLTLADAAAIAVAGRAAGVALEVAAPGAKVRYALGGILSPTVTGLGAVAGAARVSAAGRLERVAALAPADYGVGSIDATGMLTMVAFADAGGSVPTSLTLTTTAPLRIDGGASADLSANRTFSLSLGSAGQIIVMNAGATAWAAVSVSGDATLAGTGAITVSKINGTSVGAGGALSAGQVLRATGAAAAAWGAVDLADGDAITGLLPLANITPGAAAQVFVTNAGATAGTWVTVSGDGSITSTGTLTVAKVNGTSVNAGGGLSIGQVLRATGAAAAEWGALNLADGDAVTGVLPPANIDATATPTASKVAMWGASVYMGATRFYGSGTVATAGVLATANNVVAVAARSSGGTDISLLTTDGSDKITVGDAADASALDLVSSGTQRALLGAAVLWHATDKGMSIGMAPSFGGGEGVLGLVNSGASPTTSPTGGIVIESKAGAPKVWSPNKVRTTLAPEVNTAATELTLPRIFQVTHTTNATITAAIVTIALPASSSFRFTVNICGQQTGTDARCHYETRFRGGRGGAGAPSIDDTLTVGVDFDAIGVAASPTIASDGATSITIKVTGKALTEIDWWIRVDDAVLYAV